MNALATIALVVGAPAILVVHALWCACLKAGCPPWRKHWWTS